ncbi:ammonium transporter [Aquisalimonas asiatica]|uniref:Ammonia channel protein AmtB n=1 Tax=Aquisalimonas asiatica TaxID=406100 RepID=A0A1H8Q081_9GAMM|nr:ammonium transporter [Aquisalimonas asiatica]SEO47327.1 Ammonia channel protein AmtB [Aquisalimonas asiatica]
MEAEAISGLQSQVELLGSISMEIYYWWCTAIMVLIHAGFLAYEMGASRVKNSLAAGVKNILALAYVIAAFYFFGWWIYGAFPGGFTIAEGASIGAPWSESMGPNIDDKGTGIFWAAFTLFGATTASILSGALIERVRLSAYVILAVILGAGVWILAGAWGWHPDGWMLHQLGYHDIGAAGVVHTVAGFFALGVLINLGPRVGKFGPNGEINAIPPHNLPMSLIGLMLIIVGFFGFLGGCIIFNVGGDWTTIYGNPTNLSAFGFTTLMGFSGGVIGAYAISREPFWMMSGALGGIISVAAGLDVYHPGVAFIVAFLGGCLIPIAGRMLEKAGIDDAVGAVSVHGIAGVWSLIASGIFLHGYPNVGDLPDVTFVGQITGAVVMILVGFIPGYGISLLLKSAGLLRVPPEVEQIGIDAVEIPTTAYPESRNVPSAGARES